MAELKKIKTALISVYHKDNLKEIVLQLNALGVKIYSTGGTKDFITGLGINVTAIDELTGFPSILDGRVKTLHPKIFGGILARRNVDSDIKQQEQYDFPLIDLVIVDLYPFEETVASGAGEDEIIEKIDIGGISLLRAAAKNFKDVAVICSQKQYHELLSLLDEKQGNLSLEDRMRLAGIAFNMTSHYDTAIYRYFCKDDIYIFKQSLINGNILRYGENPHQRGIFFGDIDKIFDKLNGKEISYNNLLDIDSAINLITEFEETTFAIIKHNNACGIASRAILIDAWKSALAGDPVSAFGGVLVTNTEIDKEAADEINKLFFEVIITPDFNPVALEILKQKKNRIILRYKKYTLSELQFRSALNGVLVQDRDSKIESGLDLKVVTQQAPSADIIDDLIFANKIVKNTKSNAIVLAKNKQLCASGTGQTSRVDALKQAIEKAKNFGFDLNGAVIASDAFFPFPDCIEIAYNAGIKTVIQPGGSIKDKDSIDFCNQNNIAMVFTGIRHFRH